MNITLLIINSIVFMLPAYCANATPVIAGGGVPIDLGRKFIDGKPFFGMNKTYRGFFIGLIVGSCVGVAESFALPNQYLPIRYPLFFGPALSLGALLGDLAGAFF